jgi:hypothetical protein
MALGQIQKRTLVICLDCRQTWQKRVDSLKYWKGRCRKCAQKFEKNRPEVLLVLSERARLQVIAQGGIPNARKFTPEMVSGSKGCKWKGGVTPLNAVIRHSKEYVDWRQSVFDRDDYTCQKCNVRGGQIHAHHIQLFSTHPHLRFDVDNGTTLCIPCHRKTHSEMRNQEAA